MSRIRQPPDYLIQQRRQQEDTRREILQTHAAHQDAKFKATWETRTTQKIKQVKIAEKFQQFKLQQQKELENRRRKYSLYEQVLTVHRLAQLLRSEEEKYRAQIEAIRAQENSMEYRKQQMLERARQLKAERERERQAFAEQQLERKWRYSCSKKDLTHIKGGM